MESNKKQIICLSTSPWHPIPTRKQQVMSRIPNADILYFDPPVTYIAKFKDKSAKEKAKSYKKEGEKIGNNITVYSLPPILPFYNKFRWINKINQKKLAKYISRIARKHDFWSPVLWTYSPTSADIYNYIAYRYLVYDCVDRHSAYKGFIDSDVVDEMERDLASACDMIFATADGLYDTLKQYNDNAYLIPNGANYELFATSQSKDLSIPYKMLSIPAPIFGFIGTLQECIDYSLVISAAKAHPEWSFVFVGKEQPGVVPNELKQLDNVYLLGLAPHKLLPNYISRFNVCLNLFKPGKLSKDVSPLKFYEYLATGKPIVSTLYPVQVQQYGEAIYIANSPDEFEEKCRTALEEDTAEKAEKRLSWGKECSWDSRVEQMVRILSQKNIL